MSDAVLRAWQVSVGGITSVVIAASASKAKLATLLSAQDAGYTLAWIEMRCKRARQCDELVGKLKTGICYAVDDKVQP